MTDIRLTTIFYDRRQHDIHAPDTQHRYTTYDRTGFTLLETDISLCALSPSPSAESREPSAPVALNHPSYPNENPFSFHSRNEAARIRIVSRAQRARGKGGKKTRLAVPQLYGAVTCTRARFVFLLIFNVTRRALLYSRFSVGVRAIGPTERSRFCIADREPLEKGALRSARANSPRLFLGLIILFLLLPSRNYRRSAIRS